MLGLPEKTSRCTFTLKHYRDTLAIFLGQRYQIGGFSSYLEGTTATPRHLILRHDVDVSVERLMRMVEVEKAMGVRSTIFVRTKAPGYDITTTTTRKAFERLARDGFELGLHYEAPPEGVDPLAWVHGEKRKLEETIGVAIVGAAAHRAASTRFFVTTGMLGALGLKYEAYEDRFRVPLKYLSDSRRRWREGCFCIWVGRVDGIQALVHPIWWKKGSLRDLSTILHLALDSVTPQAMQRDGCALDRIDPQAGALNEVTNQSNPASSTEDGGLRRKVAL